MARTPVKVPKPYETFPLYAHRNGTWCKKIDGRHVSFGPIRWPDKDDYRASWEAALTAYNRHREAVARGFQVAADPRSVDIGTLHDGFLTLKHGQAEAGKIKATHFADMRRVLRDYRDALGATMTVAQLERDPAPIQKFIALLDSVGGFHSFNRGSQYIRSLWRWAALPETGLLPTPFRWVSLHRSKPIKEFRRKRRLERAAGKRKNFDGDEVRALADNASVVLRAQILIGYFASYGNTDLAELPPNAVRVLEEDERVFVHGIHEIIPAGWAIIEFPRPKTELDRAAILPPVVVKAIRDVERLGRPKGSRKTPTLFRTKSGAPFVYETVSLDDDQLIEKVSRTDNVKQAFERLVAIIGRCQKHGWVRKRKFVRGDSVKDEATGKWSWPKKAKPTCPHCDLPLVMMRPCGFYGLRRTATTFAAVSGASADARNLFEGRAGGGVRQTFYLDPTKLHDLLLIARDLLRRFNGSDGSSIQQTPATADASPDAPADPAARVAS